LEPRAEIPVGHGQTRRAWVLSAELGYSRAIAGALVFSKEAPELLFGRSRCLTRLGALPEKLVWDREGAIHAGGGRPTDAFDRFCGELRVGWLILDHAILRPRARSSARTASCARALSPADRSRTATGGIATVWTSDVTCLILRLAPATLGSDSDDSRDARDASAAGQWRS
jgi:hypothetical protein